LQLLTLLPSSTAAAKLLPFFDKLAGDFSPAFSGIEMTMIIGEPAQAGEGMTVRPKAFANSMLCERKLSEIMRIAIAHALAVINCGGKTPAIFR